MPEPEVFGHAAIGGTGAPVLPRGEAPLDFEGVTAPALAAGPVCAGAAGVCPGGSKAAAAASAAFCFFASLLLAFFAFFLSSEAVASAEVSAAGAAGKV